MKVIAIFMILVLFFSGFDPCEEDHVMNDSCGEKTELVKTVKGSLEKGGVCSPFCQCARCSFSILLSRNDTQILTRKPSKIKLLPTISGYPTGISPSVWQPPKVV